MLKHELAALLDVDGGYPLLGPIEDFVRELATEQELPVLAIGACTMRIEEAGPALRAALERAASGEPMTADEETLFFRGLHILGGGRDRLAFQPLLRLLRRPADEVENLLGDTDTEWLARIVVGVFDGDADSLFAAITERAIDQFVRDALLGAAAFLTWEGRIDRDDMRRFLQRFHDERLADDDDFAWIGWLRAISLLGMRDMAPLVFHAWDKGWIPEGVLDRHHFEDDLAAAEQAPEDAARFEEENVGYIQDVLASLQGTVHASAYRTAPGDDADATAWGDHRTEPPPYYVTEPVINPMRHVGRNDPCPCGSGRKYKKCCLAA
jgi:hypothetical protein